MSCDKEVWRIGKERRSHADVVVSGIAADMLDEHIGILTLEVVQLAIHQPQITPVAVAADSPERSEGSQFLCHLHTADIAGVPDFVARLEVVQVLLVPIAVRIAQYAYSFQLLFFFINITI